MANGETAARPERRGGEGIGFHGAGVPTRDGIRIIRMVIATIRLGKAVESRNSEENHGDPTQRRKRELLRGTLEPSVDVAPGSRTSLLFPHHGKGGSISGHRTALNESRARFCCPTSSKLLGSSHAEKAAFRVGHSESITLNHAVSRLLPL